MNLILLSDEDFVDAGRVRLSGRRLRHVREVHRAGPGDELRVGRVNGRIGTGRVTAIDEQSLEMAVSLNREPPPPLGLTLVLALPRPKMLRRIVQTVTSCGVKRLFLMKTWRVDKSYWSTPFLSDESLREQMVLGLEQACDTVLPRVEIRKRFRPFVEDELPGIARGTCALVAHPGAETPCPRGAAGPATLVIGPEGGLIASEIDMLRAAGFTPVSLGPRILRVEDAASVLVGRLT